MNPGERIKARREYLKMSVEELARQIGKNKATVYRYENGDISDFPTSILEPLALALCTTPDFLMGWSDNASSGFIDWLNDKNNIPNDFYPDLTEEERMRKYMEFETIRSPKKGCKIPVLGKVIAGIPIEAIEEVIDYEEITEQMAHTGDFFALQIKGDSMEPQMSENDVVIVRKQEDLDSGQIGIVLVNGDEATVKKVVKKENGIMLVPFNSDKYEPWFYDQYDIETKPVKIIGRVVELRKKY